jgi:hypothetical protein
MIRTKVNNKCRQIRAWLYTATNRYFGPEAHWLQKHIMNCPRCQRRLASYGRVNLALSLIKSQPHKHDLLLRANTQAIGVLNHSLRHVSKAQKLRTVKPELIPAVRWSKCVYTAVSLTACIVIVVLMKIGIFTSIDKFQTKSQKVIRQYYASNVGQDLADEIFPESSEKPNTKNPSGTLAT